MAFGKNTIVFDIVIMAFGKIFKNGIWGIKKKKKKSELRPFGAFFLPTRHLLEGDAHCPQVTF
jgi:hypothetical protein